MTASRFECQRMSASARLAICSHIHSLVNVTPPCCECSLASRRCHLARLNTAPISRTNPLHARRNRIRQSMRRCHVRARSYSFVRLVSLTQCIRYWANGLCLSKWERRIHLRSPTARCLCVFGMAFSGMLPFAICLFICLMLSSLLLIYRGTMHTMWWKKRNSP